MVHAVAGLSANGAPEHFSVDECIQPLLCPTSCTSVPQSVAWLNHASLSGAAALPSAPIPDQSHALTIEPMYHM